MSATMSGAPGSSATTARAATSAAVAFLGEFFVEGFLKLRGEGVLVFEAAAAAATAGACSLFPCSKTFFR